MPVFSSTYHILVSANLGARDATHDRTIPAGAIVGGLVGGAVFAILCTAGWLLWSKAIQRSKEEHEREADTNDRANINTPYNAPLSLTKPWSEAYRPALLRPPGTRVKFTEQSDGCRTLSRPKPLRSTTTHSTQQTTPTRVPRLPSTVSSTSLYSAASGEERRIRAPTSLILAALGSAEAALTRGSWRDRQPLHYRESQATSGSAYSQDIGLAYQVY